MSNVIKLKAKENLIKWYIREADRMLQEGVACVSTIYWSFAVQRTVLNG